MIHGQRMIKVLFCCGSSNPTPYSEFISLSDFLNSEGFDCVLLHEEIINPLIEVQHVQRRQKFYKGSVRYEYHSSGFEDTSGLNPNTESIKSIDQLKSVKAIIPIALKQLAILIKANIPVAIKQLAKAKSSERRNKALYNSLSSVLAEEKPDLVILSYDGSLGLVPAISKLCRNRSIPVAVIQISSSDANFIARNRVGRVEHQVLASRKNQAIAKMFPDQVYHFQGEDFLFFPWEQVRALHRLKMLPKRPWFIGDSHCDKLMLINQYYRDKLEAQGAELSTAVITGQHSLDKLHECYLERNQTRDRLICRYLPCWHGEIALYALPQFYEHNLMDKCQADKVIRLTLAALDAQNGMKTLVSLHPKMHYQDYVHLELDYSNVRIMSDERLHHALPAADFFFCCFESTLLWAVLCDVIPIAFDFFDLGFPFDMIPGCQVLRNPDLLEQEIQNIRIGRCSLEKDLLTQRKPLEPFDGKSSHRIVEQLRAMVSK